MRAPGDKLARGRWRRSAVGGQSDGAVAVGGVAVLSRCTASGPAGEASGLERPIFRIKDHRAGLATMVCLTAQRPVGTPVDAGVRGCETRNETGQILGFNRSSKVCQMGSWAGAHRRMRDPLVRQ